MMHSGCASDLCAAYIRCYWLAVQRNAVSMIDDRWHSSVRVRLSLPEPLRLQLIRKFLLSEGFNSLSDGEIFHLPRNDHVQPWQVDSIVNIHVWNSEEELYLIPPFQETCTHIEFAYLLPWLPVIHAEAFVAATFRAAQHFSASAEFLGTEECTPQRLIEAIHGFAADLERRLEAPGGEYLAIAKDQKLPL
jgi:hypothetical protein